MDTAVAWANVLAALMTTAAVIVAWRGLRGIEFAQRSNNQAELEYQYQVLTKASECLSVVRRAVWVFLATVQPAMEGQSEVSRRRAVASLTEVKVVASDLQFRIDILVQQFPSCKQTLWEARDLAGALYWVSKPLLDLHEEGTKSLLPSLITAWSNHLEGSEEPELGEAFERVAEALNANEPYPKISTDSQRRTDMYLTKRPFVKQQEAIASSGCTVGDRELWKSALDLNFLHSVLEAGNTPDTPRTLDQSQNSWRTIVQEVLEDWLGSSATMEYQGLEVYMEETVDVFLFELTKRVESVVGEAAGLMSTKVHES